MTSYTAKANIPYAELTDAPNMQVYASATAHALDNLVIPKYATATARDLANPSPMSGDFAYCENTEVLWQFHDSTMTWEIAAGPLIKDLTIGNVASGFSVQATIGRTMLNGHVVDLQLIITRTGGTITESGGNIADTLLFTVTNPKFIPTEQHHMVFQLAGSATVLATLLSDGTLSARTSTTDITNSDTMTGNVCFLKD